MTVYPAMVRSLSEGIRTQRRPRKSGRWYLDIAGPYCPYPHYDSDNRHLADRALLVANMVSAAFGLNVQPHVDNERGVIHMCVVIDAAVRQRLIEAEYKRARHIK